MRLVRAERDENAVSRLTRPCERGVDGARRAMASGHDRVSSGMTRTKTALPSTIGRIANWA
jgi:hypothetical protein